MSYKIIDPKKAKRFNNTPTAITDESILIFPKRTHKFTYFWGIGRIKKISRGDEFDIVYVEFGVEQGKVRPVIVMDNLARRQILTLKCMQYAELFGIATHKMDTDKVIKVNGRDINPYRWELYACMLQGKFVPTKIDIRHRQKEIDKGEVEKDTYDNVMTENELKAYSAQVDEILQMKEDKSNYYDLFGKRDFSEFEEEEDDE